MSNSDREVFSEIQAFEGEMFSRLEAIETPADFEKYVEDYLEGLSVYRQLSSMSVDDYLFVIAGFANSPASLREVGNGEPLWRSIAKVLIYALDRE